MKKKLRKTLADKCKDFGLTDKALDDLSELGAAGLKDDATDEDIAAKADSLVPYAKAMQGEITRKTRKTQPTKQSNEEGEGEGDNGNQHNEDPTKMPEWFKPFQEQMNKLQQENDTLKQEKAASERATLIAEKAKKLGIPEFLLKGRTFKEDADLDKELGDFKQELVNYNLMPKGAVHESSTPTAQMTSEEDAWAKSLPDQQ